MLNEIKKFFKTKEIKMETQDVESEKILEGFKRIERNLEIFWFFGLLWDYEHINLPDGRYRIFFKYPEFLEIPILNAIAGRGGQVKRER